MDCQYLSDEGRCKGAYSGFGCIGAKCRTDREMPCEFNELGFYCKKFGRFECIGPANCGAFEDYMAFIKKRESHTSR
ncbi:MAG: hypothetical protein FJ151_03630 [Euryarchaeota archaeon]|nr:hypothetical protein [Euryarchaeota archaeon]